MRSVFVKNRSMHLLKQKKYCQKYRAEFLDAFFKYLGLYFNKRVYVVCI